MQRTAEKRAGISFAAGHIDGNELLFLFISARGESRKNLFGAMQALTRAALAHYKMGRCWVISDRDGTNFEVALTVLDYSPTPEDIAEGKRLFGPLKTLDVDVSGL
jgi:hypothetical protein